MKFDDTDNINEMPTLFIKVVFCNQIARLEKNVNVKFNGNMIQIVMRFHIDSY